MKRQEIILGESVTSKTYITNLADFEIGKNYYCNFPKSLGNGVTTFLVIDKISRRDAIGKYVNLKSCNHRTMVRHFRVKEYPVVWNLYTDKIGIFVQDWFDDSADIYFNFAHISDGMNASGYKNIYSEEQKPPESPSLP